VTGSRDAPSASRVAAADEAGQSLAPGNDVSAPVPVLSVRDLATAFRVDGAWTTVVKGISFDIAPRETVAIYQLMKQGRREEALAIYRWFRPLLDLDVSTYLVQNIKLAEVFAIQTNDRVRMPRQPLSGERRKTVEKIVKDALAVRPKLPTF